MSDDTATATATADPVDTGNQQVGTTQTDTASVAAPDQTGNQPETGTAAPSQPNIGKETVVPPTAPPQAVDPVEEWKQKYETRDKSYNELRTYANRQMAEMQKFRQQFDGIDPQQAREALAAAQRQQAAQQVSPFSRRHPEYSQTRSRLDRVQMFERAAEGIQDEQQVRQMAQRMGVTVDDLKMSQEARATREQMTEELLSDPDSFIADRVQGLIQNHFNQYEQYQQARTSTGQWMERNQDLVQHYAKDMHAVMDPTVPGQAKAEYVAKLLAERDALKAKLSENVEAVSTAQAQKQIVTSRAQGVSRRTAPSTLANTEDPAETLRKQGITISDPNYFKRLNALNEARAAQS